MFSKRFCLPLLIIGSLAPGTPTESRANAVTMTPDPLGDWICFAGHCGASDSTRTVDIILLSKSATPSLEFRLRVRGGGPFANSTVSFLFDFDADITDGVISTFSGSFIANPLILLAGSGTNRVVEFNCTLAPCDVDVLLEFAALPTTLDVTDAINQFVDSPGAPSQTLTATFAADTDGDTIIDALDNCTAVMNANQRDTNGDGIGNVCDPDIVGVDGIPANDCIVDNFDVAAFKLAFLTVPSSVNWNPDADFDGGDFIGFLDLAILKALFLLSPGPAANPNAASGCLP